MRGIPQPERFLLVVRQLRDAKAAKLYGVDLKCWKRMAIGNWRRNNGKYDAMPGVGRRRYSAWQPGTDRFPELERYAGNIAGY